MLTTIRGLSTRETLGALIQPLTWLLELVRGHKLAPQDLPLIGLAQAGHHYVNYVQRSSLEEVGEFAGVLASLLLAKSGALTPWLALTNPETREEKLPAGTEPDISHFDEVVATLAGRSAGGIESFSRLDFVAGAPRIARALPLPARMLTEAYEEQLAYARIRHQARVPAPIFPRIEVAIRSLRKSLQTLRAFKFSCVINDRSFDRGTTVTYFLAILALARQGAVTVRQTAPFDDIVVEWATVGSLEPAATPIAG